MTLAMIQVFFQFSRKCYNDENWKQQFWLRMVSLVNTCGSNVYKASDGPGMDAACGKNGLKKTQMAKNWHNITSISIKLG
jgi:hypothetical protein